MLAVTCTGDGLARVDPGVVEPVATPVQAVWHVPIGGRGTPVTDGAFVYFISDRNELVAVSAGTGAVAWKAPAGQEERAGPGAVLLISGPLIVVGDRDLVAFERDTGTLRWRVELSDGDGAGIHLGAAQQGTIFTGSPAGRISAVDERAGEVRWSASVATDGRTTVFGPAIGGDLVVATYTTFGTPAVGGVVALDRGSGRERWRRPFHAAAVATSGSSVAAGGPIVAGDVVIAGDGLGCLHGFELATGRIRWSIPWVPGPSAAGSSPVEFRALAVAGGVLFAGSLHGIVSAYDLRTLQERWRYYDGANGSAGFQITLAGDRLFVPFVSAGLVQLRARDGQEIWRTDRAITGLAWPPMVSGRRIYVTSASGLLAFEERR